MARQPLRLSVTDDEWRRSRSRIGIEEMDKQGLRSRRSSCGCDCTIQFLDGDEGETHLICGWWAGTLHGN